MTISRKEMIKLARSAMAKDDDCRSLEERVADLEIVVANTILFLIQELNAIDKRMPLFPI